MEDFFIDTYVFIYIYICLYIHTHTHISVVVKSRDADQFSLVDWFWWFLCLFCFFLSGRNCVPWWQCHVLPFQRCQEGQRADSSPRFPGGSERSPPCPAGNFAPSCGIPSLLCSPAGLASPSEVLSQGDTAGLAQGCAHHGQAHSLWESLPGSGRWVRFWCWSQDSHSSASACWIWMYLVISSFIAELIILTPALAHAGDVRNSCIVGFCSQHPHGAEHFPVISSPAVSSTLGTLTCRGGARFCFMDLAPGTRGGGEGTKGSQ